MRFMGGGIKELITILSYHPERAITSKYIADTLSILKITASLCHQRWHQKVKFRPLAHSLLPSIRRSPGNCKAAKTEMVWARHKIGRPNQRNTTGNSRRQSKKGQAEKDLEC